MAARRWPRDLSPDRLVHGNEADAAVPHGLARPAGLASSASRRQEHGLTRLPQFERRSFGLRRRDRPPVISIFDHAFQQFEEKTIMQSSKTFGPWSRRQVLVGGAGALAALSPFARAALATPIGTPEAGPPKDGGQWSVGIDNEPDTLDGHKASSRISGDIMRNVVDPLIAKDLNGKYVPGLAQSWDISADGLTWTFHLRQDVAFQDGTKFNAAAVKFNFDRILDPATKSAVAIGQLGPADTTTVIDEYTFQYKLKQPFAPLLYNLTDCGFTSMFSPDAVKKAGDNFGRKPVGTGPYMVDQWIQSDRIVLKRNPAYNWAPAFLNHQGKANIDTLIFRPIIDEASRTAAFDAGEIDQLRSAPSSEIKRYQASNTVWVVSNLAQSVQIFEFNVTKAPFDDIKVRQALSYAVDKQAVLAAAIDGLGVVANSFLASSMDYYWPGMEQYAPQFDVAKAKALLAADGWAAPSGGGTLQKNGQAFKFQCYMLTLDAFTRAAQVIQSNFKDVGVEMDIQTFDNATVISKLKAGEQQADVFGYIYAEPDIAYLWLHSSQIGNGLNFPHINDPKLDALIVKGRETTDQTARAAAYQELQKYFSDLAVWIPLWTPENVDVFSKRIHDASYHPNGYTIYLTAWVD
jgi:peptide/nickel transport system substrate-binding protein